MNQPVYPLKVVVASPGDVQPERDALPAVFDELNRGIAAERGLRLELIRWETDAHPGFHPDGPQGLIDPLLRIEDCDVLIGVFWKRFGTPVKDADSGTEHEFRLAYKALKETGRPQIFVYFNHQPYAPKSSAEAEQWQKVLAFKESFPPEGLWWGYEGATDFERKVRQHLTNFIRQLPKPDNKPKKKPSRTLSESKHRKKTLRSPAELFQAYRDRLAEKVSRVRLLGEDQSRPLEKVFVKLNIVEDYQRPPHDAEFLGLMDARMRTRQRLFSREEQEEDHAMPGARAGKTRRTLSPDELLRGNLKAIITGSPGAGKTTLARWLAGQELRHEDHLPVFLELKTISAHAFDEADGDLAELIFNRELAQPLDLDKAERQQLSAAFRERLRKGEATIILDGLDEVSGADYFKRLCAAVNGFNAKYRECRLLITTRPYALQTRFEGLKEMEIAPLNDRQIAEFLDYYYGEQEQWQEFQRELKRRRDLRELARVPVLLGFIVQLWREQGAVGGNRLELYQKIVQALVVRLDEEKNSERKFQVVDPDGALKRDFLRHLAFARMFDDRVRRDAERLVFTGEQIREEAKRFRDAERLDLNTFHLAADVKKTPLLREVGDDQWAFTHLTLQEYLAATALARHDDRQRIFCRAYFNPVLAEMEVLPMVLGLVSDPEQLYETVEQLPDSLTFINLRLRARRLAYEAKVSQTALKKLVDQLIQFVPHSTSLKSPYAEIVFRSFSGISHQPLDYIANSIAPLLRQRPPYNNGVVAEILGYLGGETAFNILAETVRSGSIGVRGNAAVALGEIGDERAVQVLLDFLHSSGDWKATMALRKIGGEQARHGLLAALKSSDRSVRFAATFVLDAFGGDQVIDELIEALNDEFENVRWWAAQALGEIGSERAVGILIESLKSNDSQLRWNAALALGEIKGERATEALLASLKSDDDSERLGAALALGGIGREEAVDVLFEVLEKDGNNRRNASSSLASIGGERVVEGLLKALSQDNPYISRDAARALAKIGSKEAIEGLYVALESSDKYLPLRAALELADIGDKRATSVLVKALEWEADETARREIIEALGVLGNAQAVPELLQQLRNQNTFFASERAASLLNQMPQDALAEGLLESLSHKQSPIRKRAAEVIGYYVVETVTELLSQLAASDSHMEVRQAASASLGKIKRRLELTCAATP